MTLEEAIQTLSNAGLYAQQTPEKAFCDLWIAGDPEILTDETISYQWVCWISNHNVGWHVCLPPHPAPGPIPEFTISTLEQAVSLIIFTFARRLLLEGISTKQEFEHNHRIYNEWLQAYNK